MLILIVIVNTYLYYIYIVHIGSAIILKVWYKESRNRYHHQYMWHLLFISYPSRHQSINRPMCTGYPSELHHGRLSRKTTMSEAYTRGRIVTLYK